MTGRSVTELATGGLPPPLTDQAAIRAALAAEAAASNRLPGPVFLPTPRPRAS